MDNPIEEESYRPGLTEIISAYKVPIILGSASIICIGFSLLLLIKSTQNSSPIEFSSVSGEATGSASVMQNITVDIRGSVVRPGVYSLPYGARVEDAISIAGGPTNQADEQFLAKRINRAQKISDGIKIYIPSREELELSHNDESSSQDPITSYNNINTNSGSDLNGSVSVNSASESQLEVLPGIGPITADKIISNRPYGSVNELLTKKVIGQSLFEKLKNYFVL